MNNQRYNPGPYWTMNSSEAGASFLLVCFILCTHASHLATLLRIGTWPGCASIMWPAKRVRCAGWPNGMRAYSLKEK